MVNQVSECQNDLIPLSKCLASYTEYIWLLIYFISSENMMQKLNKITITLFVCVFRILYTYGTLLNILLQIFKFKYIFSISYVFVYVCVCVCLTFVCATLSCCCMCAVDLIQNWSTFAKFLLHCCCDKAPPCYKGNAPSSGLADCNHNNNGVKCPRLLGGGWCGAGGLDWKGLGRRTLNITSKYQPSLSSL